MLTTEPVWSLTRSTAAYAQLLTTPVEMSIATFWPLSSRNFGEKCTLPVASTASPVAGSVTGGVVGVVAAAVGGTMIVSSNRFAFFADEHLTNPTTSSAVISSDITPTMPPVNGWFGATPTGARLIAR